MASHAGQWPAPSTTNRPKNEGRVQERPTPEDLIRQAHRILESRNAAMSPSKVSKLARRYLARPDLKMTFEAFLANELDCRLPMGHRDPTGEQAARNADRAAKVG